MALKVRSVSKRSSGGRVLVVMDPLRWKNSVSAKPDAQPKVLLPLKEASAAELNIRLRDAA